MRYIFLIAAALLAAAHPSPAQDLSKAKTSLKAEARRWLMARHKVLKRCDVCSGRGYRDHNVLTRRGVVTKRVKCKPCAGNKVRLSTPNLEYIWRPFLKDATFLSGVGGQRLTKRRAKAMFKRNVKRLAKWVGHIEDYPQVESVEVSRHASGLIIGVVVAKAGSPLTRWVLRGKRWFVVGPDDERRLIAEAAKKTRFEVAEGVDERAHQDVIRSARSLRDSAAKWTKGFARRRLLVEPGKDEAEPVRVVLEVGYGKMVPTPRTHERHRDEALVRIAEAMQGDRWSTHLTSIVLRTRFTVVDEEGAPLPRPVESVIVERTRARQLHLPRLKPSTVYTRFRHVSHLEKGHRIWDGKRS